MVDDDPTVHTIVKGILRKFGYECHTADGALDALGKIRRIQPHLVLTDVSMPEINGVEFCERLKADHELASVPVIFFTANSDPETLAEAFEAGGCDFLVKPLKPFELASRARHHIRQFRKARDAEAAITSLDTRNQTMVKFLGVASHDLRNPLIAIRGISEYLESEKFGPLSETQIELVQTIHQSSESMLFLVNELLEISKFNESLKKIETKPTQLVTILELSLRLHSIPAEKKKIRLRLDAPEYVPQARVESRLITRVFDNLISNAIKFSPEDTRVDFQVRFDEKHVFVSVKDEGPGIPEDEFDKLFKEFSRTSNEPTAGEASNGLGLYVCKSILEAHKGRITVENRPGGGAAFHLEIPRAL